MANIFAMTDTWTGGTAYTAILMNVTDTSSTAGSMLLDLQVGGSSKFSVNKIGQVVANGPVIIAGVGNFGAGVGGSPGVTVGTAGSGMFSSAGGALVGISALTAVIVAFSAFGFGFKSSVPLGWSSNDPSVDAFDLSLVREAANILGQYNVTTGTLAQTQRIYNTRTNSSNYERLAMDWATTANVFKFGTEQAGTGTARPVAMVAGGSEIIRLLTAGNVKFTNAANFTANNTTATALTAVGPAGANTTVQEWLTIQNAAGTTRYIPCF